MGTDASFAKADGWVAVVDGQVSIAERRGHFKVRAIRADTRVRP